MPKQTVDAEGKLVSVIRLRFLRIQGRLYLDALGRYWPLPRVFHWLVGR